MLAGLIAAFTGFFSYITRYANLDSLAGTIDESLYEQITQMFIPEKVLLLGELFSLSLVRSVLFGASPLDRKYSEQGDRYSHEKFLTFSDENVLGDLYPARFDFSSVGVVA
ncbi:hypothetical protein SAMN04489740_2854 [Arthrobacter alpinus]|uniref:Uncharacterized protein n=1 Tax=Arthrobacter alpinus TaxID=656366 RepID=A0A1H5MCE1_9MICC|nr:hypothetical protein SAMN04489740_2854 [Arthrobacter alpinus]